MVRWSQITAILTVFSIDITGSRSPRSARHQLLHSGVTAPPCEDRGLAGHLLRQLGIVLLEAVAHALLGGHPLHDAAVDAAALARRDRLGGEVVDAGVEAVLDETAKCLCSESQ